MSGTWRVGKTVAVLLVSLVLPAYAADRPGWTRHGCRDTRALILAERCTDVRWDARGCRVTAATCRDDYAGSEISADTAAQAFQVDHRLPWAWLATARAWSPEELTELYNDKGNLEVVRSRTNGRKGDAMPHEWCPANAAARPRLSADIRSTGRKWRLALPLEDIRALALWAVGECAPGSKIVP